ncbi:MAG: peptidoglycan DD-metalloendopeptidase family protein [Pseudomonadota bacterium]
MARRPARRRLSAALAGAVLFGAAGLLAAAAVGDAALAQGAETPRRAADMLSKAEAALAAARTPRERLAALGRAAQAQEAALRALRFDLSATMEETASLERRMASEERRLAAVLAALPRIVRAPRVALMTHPGGPVAAARAGVALAGFAPALKDEAAEIRTAIETLRDLTNRRRTAREASRASLAALQSARAEIAALLEANRGAAETPAPLVAKLAEEGAALAQNAADIAALSRGLARQRSAAAAGPSFSAAKGALVPPVEGEVTRNFGEDGAVARYEGVEITAPAYAEVYAPWRGVIRFASRFGDDGVVVILEPEPDTLLVLSGLGAARHAAGDVVLAGESLGTLAGPASMTEEFLIAAASTVEAYGAETLYMELRKNGAPVDPAAWFAFETEKR